jgi:hypothetical protein
MKVTGCDVAAAAPVLVHAERRERSPRRSVRRTARTVVSRRPATAARVCGVARPMPARRTSTRRCAGAIASRQPRRRATVRRSFRSRAGLGRAAARLRAVARPGAPARRARRPVAAGAAAPEAGVRTAPAAG